MAKALTRPSDIPPVQLLAAEALCRRAAARPPAEAEALLARARAHLVRLSVRKDSPLRASAAAALAALHARAGHKLAARMALEPLMALPADTPVAFGDIRGMLGEVAAAILAGRPPSPTSAPAPATRPSPTTAASQPATGPGGP